LPIKAKENSKTNFFLKKKHIEKSPSKKQNQRISIERAIEELD